MARRLTGEWAPVFPLPNMVFFPRTEVPLHIFEPRYRAMVSDALQHEKRIVISLLKPGWERDYFGNPPCHEVATLGEITEHEPLEDGRFNIVLRGLFRVRLREWTSGNPYRMARPEAIVESRPAPDSNEAEARRNRILGLVQALVQESPSRTTLSLPATTAAPLEALVNGVIHASELAPEIKQRLLERDDLRARADDVESLLEQQIARWSELQAFRKLRPDNVRLN
jgi:hypothetical protein